MSHNLKELIDQLDKLPKELSSLMNNIGKDLSIEEQSKLVDLKKKLDKSSLTEVQDMLSKAQKDIQDAK